MAGFRTHLHNAFALAIVTLVVSAPITAFADLSDLDPINPIDLVDDDDDDCLLLGIGCPPTTTTTAPATTTTTRPGNGGCGNGNGNGNEDKCTTTTTVASTTTTAASTTTRRPPATTTVPTPPDDGDDRGEPGAAPGEPEPPAPAPGLGSLDMSGMSNSMAGAVEMIMGANDEPGDAAIEENPDGVGMMSGRAYAILSPVLPPALVDAVSSPLVIVDALLGALTSSGQALIVPGIAFLFGVGIPSIRRRVSLADLEEP